MVYAKINMYSFFCSKDELECMSWMGYERKSLGVLMMRKFRLIGYGEGSMLPFDVILVFFGHIECFYVTFCSDISMVRSCSSR